MAKKLAVMAVVIALLPSPALSIDFPYDRFAVETEQLHDDVYVIRRSPSWRIWVQANVTVIINENDAVVVDGGGYPAHVENVIAEIKAITDKPVSTIVMTHWHQDHNYGVHLYREHYPGVRIVAHSNTRKVLAERGDDDLARVQRPEFEEQLRQFMMQRISNLSEQGADNKVIAFYDDALSGATAVASTLQKAQNNLAEQTFDSRMVLHRGRRTIEILYLGRANTNGDAIVWLPREKIVVTGDVVVLPTPYGFGSYPREWAEVLRQISDLGFGQLVPGHGPTQTDSRYLRILIEMLEDLSDQTDAAVASGAKDVDEARAAVDFAEHERRLTADDALLRYIFDIWFKTPIMESAFEQAAGRATDTD